MARWRNKTPEVTAVVCVHSFVVEVLRNIAMLRGVTLHDRTKGACRGTLLKAMLSAFARGLSVVSRPLLIGARHASNPLRLGRLRWLHMHTGS